MSDYGQAEWHQWRAEGIGASQVGAILGISPFATPYSVWVEKTSGIRSGGVDNVYTEFGQRAESMLARWFQDLTGLYVCGEQTWCSHPEHPWRRATVDGFVCESPETSIVDALGVWEAKTTGAYSWDEIPAHILAQVQWQLHVTGMPQAWVTTLHGRRCEIYEVVADPDDIAFIVDEVERFWTGNVLERKPPPVDGTDATARALAALHPQHEPALEVEVPASLVADLVSAKRRAKLVGEHLAALENELREAMGDAEIATVDGQRVATWKTQTARRVDIKRLEAEQPELAEKYRTETSTRVLRVHQQEKA